MTNDFTYGMYATLLEAGLDVGFPFLTVREYLSMDAEELPPAFIVLRHDVDRKPANALDFARIEAERGIASTYYVRTVPTVFDPDLVREIESLGHEIGYHYEDMDRADGDVEAAHVSFARHLARLREVATVDTVCMHGNPLTPHDNRDMWRDDDEFDEYGLLGEAYLSMDFEDVAYYSDTGRTWRDGALKVKDHTFGVDGGKRQASTTGDLVDLLRETPDGRFCLLSHPDRWADTPAELVTETAFDTAKNVSKYAMHVVTSRGG
ncbi:hypothetical protein [Halorarius litoreus]|uniref:hypothetical protein n=1 Tax=Halorarius litoreus TaxID=2962676 RepID=UPI0020CDC4CE|nr:hypothetical protein [Halorarius litoreus]